MRIREPLLYEQYIGRYLTDEEVGFISEDAFGFLGGYLVIKSIFQLLERSQEALSDGAEEAPGAGTGGLAHLLLNSYQERLIQNRLQEEQEREGGVQEEDDDGECWGEKF